MSQNIIESEPRQQPGERLLTLEQFAERINVGPGAVRALRKQGRLEVIALNTRVLRVPEREVNRILSGH